MNKREPKAMRVPSDEKTDGSRLAYIEKQVATWPEWKKSYSTPESVRGNITKAVVKA